MRADLQVLRNRSFLLLFSARSLSLLGDSIATVALAFAVLSMPHGSGSTLGFVLATRLTARVAFLLYGGVLADRFARNRVMVWADLTAGTAQAAIALLVLTGTASTLKLASLSVVGGAAGALFTPASRAVMIQLVPKEKVQSANALLQLSTNVGTISGTAIAGVLVALLGPGWALAADAATFLASATLLAGIRLIQADTSRPAATGSFHAQLMDGWREFTARRWVWISVGQMAVVNTCIGGGFLVLGPVVAKTQLGGASAWAAVLAAQAIGFPVGSLVALRFRPRRPVLAAALFTLGLVPVFVCLAFGAPVAVTSVAMAVTGMCITLNDITFQTALQKHIPPASLARVMAYDSLGSFVFIPLGLLIVTPIANLSGIDSTLVGAAALLVLAALVTQAIPSIRRVRDDAATVAPGQAMASERPMSPTTGSSALTDSSPAGSTPGRHLADSPDDEPKASSGHS